MVVLAASICTKSGKALLSRQFVEISRVRIEGLLAAFPKLVGPDTQHTYIETENVRYVYHPLENLYFVLITSKGSNILEDLDTLQLMARIIPEYCKAYEEEEIISNSFELIFAFDEVISLGYKEKITNQQIKLNLEMDSHDERISEMAAKNKEREAANLARQKQMQIEKEKEQMKNSGITPGKYSGMGGGGGAPSYSSGGFGSTSSIPHSEPNIIKSSPQPERNRPAQSVKSSMVLGKGGKNSELMKQLEAEGEISQDEPRRTAVTQTASSAPAKAQKSVHVKIDEKLHLVTEKDGGLKAMDVKGEFIVQISDPNYSRIKLKLNNNYNTSFQYRTHPNLDKKLYSEGIVGAVDRPFPLNTPHVVLKWRYQPKDDSAIPLSVFCWPSTGSEGTTLVSMEYELLNTELDIKDLIIVIPIPGGHAPVVNSNDGEYKYDVKGYLNWKLPIVNAGNPSGKMEFTIPFSGDTSSLFPINVTFSSSTTFANIRAEGCVDASNNVCPFSSEIRLSTEKFVVE